MTHSTESAEVEILRLQEELIHKTRLIEMISEIDRIRDTLHEPNAMLNAIVTLMSEEFAADLALLALKDRLTGRVELRSMTQKESGQTGTLESMIQRELAAEGMDLEEVTIWDDKPFMSDSGFKPDAQIAVIPIRLEENDPLGVMMLARQSGRFSAAEVDLLTQAEDHIDSAILQGYAYDELQHQNKRLALIHEIDLIRDMHLPIDSMLNKVLQVLADAVPSEMGFAMIYDQKDQQLSLRATAGEDLFAYSPTIVQELNRLSREALNQSDVFVANQILKDHLRSFICIPLILKDRIIGVLGLVNRYHPDGFGMRDRAYLSAIGSQIDTAIYESMEKRHLRQVLGRTVGPAVMDQILAGGSDMLKTERMVLSVLYADIRGSTRLAEEIDPELLVEFINEYLSRMSDVVLDHGGTLDKFIGDEVMALFGAPMPMSDHASRAIEVGLAMQQAQTELLNRWSSRGIATRPIGIGIATGELIVGEIGSSRRTDYTVIGRAANLGARICGVAKAGEVLICPHTYDLARNQIETETPQSLAFKGIPEPINIYSVVGFGR